MANAVRFSTLELSEIEGRIASATERALSIEEEVFTELAAAIERERGLGAVAVALAELDATAGLAELARTEGYTRPRIDASQAFEIRGGRHPVDDDENELLACHFASVRNPAYRSGERRRRRAASTGSASASR